MIGPRVALTLTALACLATTAAVWPVAREAPAEIAQRPVSGSGFNPADIRDIRVVGPDVDMRARRVATDQPWTIDQLGGFPGDPDLIANTLGELANLTILGARTNQEPLHGVLGLGGSDAGSDAATRMTLTGDQGVVMDLLIGAEQRSGYWLGAPGRYIRTPGESQTWLAAAPLRPVTSPLDWIDPTLFSVDSSRIRSMEVETTDETVAIERAAPGDGATAWLSDGTTRLDRNAQLSLMRGFYDLRVVDARPATDVAERTMLRRVSMTSFDGIAATATLFPGEEPSSSPWAVFSIRFAPSPDNPGDIHQPSDFLTTDEAGAEVSRIRPRIDGFAFRLPPFVIDRLTAPLIADPAQSSGEN